MRIPKLVLLVLASLALMLGACGGGDDGAPEALIVTSDDGRLTLTIPPGALDEDVEITITSVPLEELPQALQEVQGAGDGYRLEPEGLRFLGPVTVSLELDRDELEDEPEGEITAYALVSLTEDGERELLDEPVTEATLGEDTIVVRGELGHFSWLTRTKSSLKLFLEKVKTEQPVGGKFTAKIKAKNTDESGGVRLEYVWTNMLGFGHVSYDGGGSKGYLFIAGATPLHPGEETDERTEPFLCAESPGRGTYGVQAVSLSTVTVPDQPEGEISTIIRLVIDSLIDCVAPATPTPTTTATPTPTPEPTPTPTSGTAPDDDDALLEFSDPLDDATDCATGAAVDDPAVEISGVNVKKVGETIVVEVVPVQSPTISFEEAYSIAVILLLFGWEGLAEIHAGEQRQGQTDSSGNVISGTEDNVEVTDRAVTFTVTDGESIPKGSLVEVMAFHAETEGGNVNCDTFMTVYQCFGRCDD